jgi:NAD(P)H-nitrite reductase large subunit
MAGADLDYLGGLAMNSISFYGLPTASVGIVNPPEDDPVFEIATFLDQDKEIYRKLVYRNDRLVGYVLVGDIDLAGIYTGFIRFQIPLDQEAKDSLAKGAPSALYWPEDVFDGAWSPSAAAQGR